MKIRDRSAALVFFVVIVMGALSCRTADEISSPEESAGTRPSAEDAPSPSTVAPPAELLESAVTSAKWEDGAELISVGFAAEGGFIIVRFKLPPEEAARLMQGQVSVTNEVTGTTYREIPMMPRIGPLITRPKREGQAGYVMLTNAPQRLSRGSVVTVVLGKYKQEHVLVQ